MTHYHGIILTDVVFRLQFKPLGAYRIANVLRDLGYNILVIDMFTEMELDDLKKLLSTVISDQTLFLGYSSTFFSSPLDPRLMSKPYVNTDDSLPFSRDFLIGVNSYAKELNPNIKVIYGGAGTIFIPNVLKNEERDIHIDYLVEGYAEAMIIDIIERIKENKPQQSSHKIKNTEVINYDNSSKLYDFRNHCHMWDDSDIMMHGEVLPLEVARGCIFKCKFCTYPLIGKNKNDLSYIRDEDKLAYEFEKNYDQYGTTLYAINDGTFNERTDKMEMLLRAKERSKVDLEFSAYIRIDLVAKKPEQLSLLSQLNVIMQYYGIESLTRESAASIGKGCDPNEIVDTVHKMYEAFNNRVSVTAGQIVGLPFESPKTLESSIDRLLATPIDNLMFFPLFLTSSAYGDSVLLSDPKKYGYDVTIDSEGFAVWKNEHWDFFECFQIASELEKKHVESGRLRLDLNVMTGMINLGYKFDDIRHMTMKEFYSDEIVAETFDKRNQRRDSYFNSLYQYLNKY